MGDKDSNCNIPQMIPCACGCGEQLPLYDKQGRRRSYIFGHKHPQKVKEFHTHNPLISCACGCGGQRFMYDKKGRKHLYIKGHQRRKDGDVKKLKQYVDMFGTPAMAGKALGIDKKSIRNMLKVHNISYYTDLTKVGGTTAFGRKAELDALKMLPGSTDATCNNAQKSPYDLLWGNKRINIKASTIKDSGKNKRWAFTTTQKNKCDYYFCLGYNDKLCDIALLIPANKAPGCISVPVNYKSKWMEYAYAIK